MKPWAAGAVVLILLLPVGGIAQTVAPLDPVDLDEPEFLVIFNLHSQSFDIYANEYPEKTPSTGATHFDYTGYEDSGAYQYEAETLYLAWEPLHPDHAPDGRVDAEIQVPRFDPNHFVLGALAALMDAQLKRQGCGVDVSHMGEILTGEVFGAQDWWLFEGLIPRDGGYDGLMEFCVGVQ